MKQNIFDINNLKNDFSSSIIVFLVAVPLCLGIAFASGAPMFSGIIAGFVGGIVVTTFSGSSLGVSGPAAGLVVIVLSAIQELGFEAFLLAVAIAGVLQIALGFLKAGVIAYYFPSAVIKGMLSGIGLIIILKQIPHAVGYDIDFAGDNSFFQADGHNTFSELFYMLDFITPGALIASLVGIGIILLWERPFMKKIKLFQLVQGPLVAVISGIGLNLTFQGIPALRISEDHLVKVPVPENFAGFFGQFSLPDFSQITNPEIYIVAITLAIVASLETLLCVEATDKLDPYKRITPTNRELKAQGIGNIISGLIGGLPVTQVIVRSSANIQSGGKTKASAFLHGVFLLVSAMTIPHVLNLIPLATLAAILLIVGYKLAKPAIFIEMYQIGRRQFIPFIVTILAILFTDLLMGITIGLVIAILYILLNNLRKPYELRKEKEESRETFYIELAEDVTFLNKANIQQALKDIPSNTNVVIDASRSQNIDYDVIELIDDFRENVHHRDIELKVYGLEEGESHTGQWTKHNASFGEMSRTSESPKTEEVA